MCLYRMCLFSFMYICRQQLSKKTFLINCNVNIYKITIFYRFKKDKFKRKHIFFIVKNT